MRGGTLFISHPPSLRQGFASSVIRHPYTEKHTLRSTGRRAVTSAMRGLNLQNPLCHPLASSVIQLLSYPSLILPGFPPRHYLLLKILMSGMCRNIDTFVTAWIQAALLPPSTSKIFCQICNSQYQIFTKITTVAYHELLKLR